MKKIIYLFALFLCVQIVMAQQDSSYLPLAVGNYWQFAPRPPYTVFSPKYTVTHDTIILGKQYFFIEEDSTRNYGLTFPWPPVGPVREDEKGDIYAYIKSIKDECLQYRFSQNGYYSSCFGNIRNMGFGDNIGTTIVIGGEVEANFHRVIGPTSFGIHEYEYILSKAVINNICVTCQPQVGVEKENSIPKTMKLYQNYPNPFNPTTNISFELKSRRKVKLTIFDLLGKIIDIPINSLYETGKHQIIWNANNRKKEKIGSAVYYYQLEAGDFKQINKMVLVK
jgi:hypothetical protein